MLKRSNILTVTALALLFCSCSSARLNRDGVSDGETEAEVKLTVEWPASVVDKPEQMYVVANRLVGTTHFGYLYPEMTPVDPEAEAVPLPAFWPKGDYYVLSFSRNDELHTPSANLFEFPSSSKVSLKDISVSLPVMTSEEKEGLFEVGMRDFNPCAEFIKDAGNFYTALNIQSIAPGRDEVVITPKSLVQNIRIRFTVELLDSVKINSVRTFVSGAARHLYPMTSIVNYGDLYKVAMPVSLLNTSGNDSQYESSANFLGLFPAESSETMTGNGIFQVILSATSEGTEKIFYAAINLKKTITDSGIMRLADDQSGYLITRNSSVLDIEDILRISKDGVVGSTAADGVDKWVVHEYVDVEI